MNGIVIEHIHLYDSELIKLSLSYAYFGRCTFVSIHSVLILMVVMNYWSDVHMYIMSCENLVCFESGGVAERASIIL